MESDSCPVMFAVMGMTGTVTLSMFPGKSKFIQLLTNDENIHVGHSQDSEESEVRSARYIDQKTGRYVVLIDTPGFDDSHASLTDTNILEKIVEFLEPKPEEQRRVNGVIYMHRIYDPRVGGVSRRNLRMLRSLCGGDNLGNVQIVTTNWDRVSEQEGKQREVDLSNGAFKDLIDAGAKMRRHANTLKSAQQIMSELISLQPVTMQVQIELHQGKKLADTTGGQVLTEHLREVEKEYKELAALREEMETAAKAQDHAVRTELAQERKVLEEWLESVEADTERLERTLDEIRIC